jgi:putative oxidoreductase
MKKKAVSNFAGNILVRLMVGLVFLSEGLQKLILPGLNGVGRFIKIGIPHPAFFAPFVGVTEIVCGCLLVLGLATRLACIPLLIVICAAIYYTKLPVLNNNGFWAAVHDGRADFCMLMGLIFLVSYGAGKYAIDSSYQLNARR